MVVAHVVVMGHVLIKYLLLVLLIVLMAVLAAMANGKSSFTGIERARIKESNRVSAVREGLLRLGIGVMEDRDSLSIIGLKTPKPKQDTESGDDEKEPEENVVEEEKEPVVIDSHFDHRIAMAFGVLGVANGGVIIDGAEHVAKTFPDYWDALKSLGVDLNSSE